MLLSAKTFFEVSIIKLLLRRLFLDFVTFDFLHCREKSNPENDAELRKGLQQIIGDHPASSKAGDQQRAKGPRELRTAHPHDIEDCENLLENYFMQVMACWSYLHVKTNFRQVLKDPCYGLFNPGNSRFNAATQCRC